jgi:hypothetical protein
MGHRLLVFVRQQRNSVVTLNGQAVPPQVPEPVAYQRQALDPYSRSRRKLWWLFGIAVFAPFFLIMLMMLLITSENLTGVRFISMLLPIAVFSSFLVLFVVAIFLARARMASRPHVLTPEQYDQARYKRFHDCLEAVCIGAGEDVPPLVVTDVPSPVAYISSEALERRSSGFNVFGPPPPAYPLKPKFALGAPLLQTHLEYYEDEAIMAVLLARTIISPMGDPNTGSIGSYYDHWVKELGLSTNVVENTRTEFTNDSTCLYVLLADAYAARLTGQPMALKQAILKSDALLRVNPSRPRDVLPNLMFVEPASSNQGGRVNLPGWMFQMSVHSSGRQRDRILELRVESLDFIAQGMRQPFEEVRGGIPVTKPEGWE